MSDDTNGHRCIFCWSYGEMTREHPMSKRVLDLAGFTLDDIHIEIDIPLDQLTPEYVAERSHSIADEFVTCVCADCNNGWMQKLDHSFAGTVRRWVAKPSDRLGNTGLAVIRRYMLKVLWVKALGEIWGTPGLITDAEIQSPVILNPKDGTRIKDNDLGEMSKAVSLGAAAVDSSRSSPRRSSHQPCKANQPQLASTASPLASSLHYRSSKSSFGSSSDSRRNARRSGPTVKWHGSRGTPRTVNFRWARCARTSAR